MTELCTNGIGNDQLACDDTQKLQAALSILARIITRAVLKERAIVKEYRSQESPSPAVRAYPVTAEKQSNEPLTLNVKETARMLGLSRASAYEAIRKEQIPSLKFGRRIAVPRAALDRMIQERITTS